MPRSAGFTLLELLVVIGVLSVLMGLSVGYLGKTDVSAIANSVLAGELRAAQMTARVEGAPTEVLVRP
ncbi:MAG: prepilin-type N-terminal cleavage/methylation domain-containing protein, partial [Planctomycetota bacterium]